MKIVTWNTAGWTKRIAEQAEFVKHQNADVICLQEVLDGGLDQWSNELRSSHPYVIKSNAAFPIDDKTGPRKYRLLIGSKNPVRQLVELSRYVPWPERLLVVSIDGFQFPVATTHIPPGSGNGWTKIDFFIGLKALLLNKQSVLCGDFNSPKAELANGETVTFGQRLNKEGIPVIRRRIRGGSGEEWHRGEWDLLRGLESSGYIDAFRNHHGFDVKEYSWQPKVGKGNGYRFDHFIVPKDLNVLSIHYDSEPEQNKLSDHKPLLMELSV